MASGTHRGHVLYRSWFTLLYYLLLIGKSIETIPLYFFQVYDPFMQALHVFSHSNGLIDKLSVNKRDNENSFASSAAFPIPMQR